ncbi:MAG TPA: hypothetical protein VHU40_13940 [Polyangia bacterium]|jgi:hypothetical protein|nr:hypothetical protein [Polyangia bacterium]
MAATASTSSVKERTTFALRGLAAGTNSAQARARFNRAFFRQAHHSSGAM